MIGPTAYNYTHFSLKSVNKKPTYKPTYVRKKVPEATRKKIDMAPNGQ